MMLSSKNQNAQNGSHEQQLASEIADPVNLLRNWNSDEITEITDYLSKEDVCNLALTSQFIFYKSIKPVLDQHKLAHHVVVEPNEEKMIAMLNCAPTLVNAMIKRVLVGKGDYEKTLLNNTILQLAYGAGDHDMVLAMKPFFIKVYGSEEAAIKEMDRQRNEKFAENKEEDAKEDERVKIHLKALLESVIGAISNEEFNSGKDANNRLILSSATIIAINTFRKEFTDSQPKRIEKGLHFRDNTVLEMLNAYSNAAMQWRYNYNKCALFEDGVLIYVLLYMPANVIQKFSQGLCNLQEMGEKFTRPAAMRDGNNFYLVARGPSFDFSLDGCCVDTGFGTIRPGGPGVAQVVLQWAGPPRRIKAYVEQKRQNSRAYAVKTTTEVSAKQPQEDSEHRHFIAR